MRWGTDMYCMTSAYLDTLIWCFLAEGRLFSFTVAFGTDTVVPAVRFRDPTRICGPLRYNAMS